MVAEFFRTLRTIITGRDGRSHRDLAPTQRPDDSQHLFCQPGLDFDQAARNDSRWWRTVSGTISVTPNDLASGNVVAAQTLTGLLNDYQQRYYTATQAAIYNNMMYGTGAVQVRTGYTASVVDDTPSVAPARRRWKERMVWLKREKLGEK